MTDQDNLNDPRFSEKRSIRDIPLKNKYVDVSEEKSDLKTEEIATHEVSPAELKHIESLEHITPVKTSPPHIHKERVKKDADEEIHGHKGRSRHKTTSMSGTVPPRSIDGQIHHVHKDYTVEPAFYGNTDSSFVSEHEGDIQCRDEGRKSKVLLWAIGVLVVLAILFFLLHVFSHAKISIIRSAEVVSLNDDSFTLGTDLIYKDVKFDIMASTSISASGAQTSSAKAGGQVVIYNESGADQKLVSGTRLEAANGKIFRLTSNITAGAATTLNKKSVPGSVAASVVADEGGTSYNSPLTDFKFPGFKGIAKYDTIYARSKTPMTGGGVGHS